MLATMQIQIRQILHDCNRWVFDNTCHSKNDGERFRRILSNFLQLGPDTQRCRWLAGHLEVSPSSIIRFTMRDHEVPPQIRAFIVQTIQNKLSDELKQT